MIFDGILELDCDTINHPQDQAGQTNDPPSAAKSFFIVSDVGGVVADQEFANLIVQASIEQCVRQFDHPKPIGLSGEDFGYVGGNT